MSENVGRLTPEMLYTARERMWKAGYQRPQWNELMKLILNPWDYDAFLQHIVTK